jgi:serine/threonine protein kinase
MGCILFQMMTGKNPFEKKDRNENNQGILDKINNRNYSASLPDKCPELRDLVNKIFTKEKDHRPTIT